VEPLRREFEDNSMIQLFKPYVSEEAIVAVSEVLRSGWIGIGPKTAEFEKTFAEYIGARHAVAVNSATSALHLAMVVSGVTEGDEVLTTSFTFVSTNHAILYQRATPVFVDIDDRTLNIDLNKAERMVTARTKAIVAVHYSGNPVHIDKLYTFAARHGLAVIEDAAHACGAYFSNKRIGSFGLTAFSFHAVKNLPLGDGGMLTTNEDNICDQLIRLRWVGIDKSTFARSAGNYQWEYQVSDVGYKYHMNDINAAIGIEHLKKLDDWNRRRKEIVVLYRTELSDIAPSALRFVETTPGGVSSNHLCVIRVKNRDSVIDRLKDKGIGVGVHYKPNHHYPPYARTRHDGLPVTEQAYREVISLPLHLLLTDDDVRKVCEALRHILT
jgi:perosamine synthetase